jgi:methylphosphotriester-DNA--protein-cysteine methyltransferase
MGKDSFYVTFPEDIVRQGLTTVTSQDSPHLPTHTLVLEAQADRFATLREALLQICDHAGRNPDSSSSAAARRSMERALITSWVQAWISARPVGRADGSRTMWYSEHNLEVALEYLKEHQNQTVRLPDLCRRCGVCLRTMEVLFKRNLGVGPIHYLKLRRMQQVRKELRAADSFRTYVKQVALDAGFWDLGRLAVEYKRMFQEAPSTTLRKREPSGRVTL